MKKRTYGYVAGATALLILAAYFVDWSPASDPSGGDEDLFTSPFAGWAFLSVIMLAAYAIVVWVVETAFRNHEQETQSRR